tara:strand:+ start:145 stop:765 length:621 start_codon:yes stop_codon:yes gene_type:complete
MTYTSSKVIELGSAAFRQPNASSHCKYLHGYQLKAELTFGCEELDNNNWVFDFGGLKDLKGIFNNQFDHTTVISGSDPELDTFKELANKDIIQLRIMDGGVGIEKFAEWCFKTADTFVDEASEGRVWVENVTVYEHNSNYASCSKPIKKSTLFKDEEGKTTYVEVKEEATEESEETSAHNPRAARVGSDVREGNFSDPFAGTSWGN